MLSDLFLFAVIPGLLYSFSSVAIASDRAFAIPLPIPADFAPLSWFSTASSKLEATLKLSLNFKPPAPASTKS